MPDVEPYRPHILASTYASQVGRTTGAIVKRIQRGKLDGFKNESEDRWYVYVPQKQTSRDLVALQEADQPVEFSRDALVQWLLARNEQLNRQNGELRQEVKELRTRLEARRLIDEDRRLALPPE